MKWAQCLKIIRILCNFGKIKTYFLELLENDGTYFSSPGGVKIFVVGAEDKLKSHYLFLQESMVIQNLISNFSDLQIDSFQSLVLELW